MPWHGRRLTVALLSGLVLVILLGTGAAVALSATRHRAADSAAPGVAATGAEQRSGRRIAAAPTGGTATDGSGGPSNNSTVQLLAGARSAPRAQDVQQLLQSYFDAINQHDYGNWAQVVAPALAQRQDSEKWLDAYASTVDSSIAVESITGSPPHVRVRFTSQQDIDLAPADLPVDCIDWVLTLKLEQHAEQLSVGATVPGSVTMSKCG